MKKFACVLVTLLIAAAVAFGGCGSFGGADGRDGQDLNIYDIYNAANAEREEEGQPQLTFLEFLKEYLNYNFEYDEDKSLQTFINRSLLSSVNIVADFGSYNSSDKRYAGSGVIVDVDKEAGDAYILTNAHIVYKSDAYPQTSKAVSVYLYGNDIITTSSPHISSNNVEIVNYSLSYDVALLKVSSSDQIKNSDVRAAVFADSESVYIGETVYTVGNPGASGLAVSKGIISKDSEPIALNFSGESKIYRTIRTDAGVNSGNSGGALFDTSGRIIGLINAKDPDAENENMGYALCGSYVKRLYKLMKDGYKYPLGYGIRRAVFPAEYGYTSRADFDNETGLTEITDTVYVLETYGGLRNGDIITHIKITGAGGAVVEDMDIKRYFNISDALISAREGSKITYTVSRGGSQTDITFDPTFEYFV